MERYFEDYVVGETVTCQPVVVDEDEMLSFARRFDPQPFHVDPVAAAHSPYGSVIASGWFTCALMMRSLVTEYLSPTSSLGSPGLENLRWVTPVRAGEVLTLAVTVKDARVSASKPDRGILRSELRVVDRVDELRLSMIAVNLVLRKPAP